MLMKNMLKFPSSDSVSVHPKRPLSSKFKAAAEALVEKFVDSRASRYIVLASAALIMSLSGPKLFAQYSQSYDSTASRTAVAGYSSEQRICGISITCGDTISSVIYNNMGVPMREEKTSSVRLVASGEDLIVDMGGRTIRASSIIGAGPSLIVQDRETGQSVRVAANGTQIRLGNTDFNIHFVALTQHFTLSVYTDAALLYKQEFQSVKVSPTEFVAVPLEPSSASREIQIIIPGE